jgi:hypothetical protein
MAEKAVGGADDVPVRLWVHRGEEVSIWELPLLAAAPDLGLMNGRNQRRAANDRQPLRMAKMPQTGPSHSSGFCVFAVRQSATPVFISLTRWCPPRLH